MRDFPSEGAHCFLPLDPTGYRARGTHVVEWAGVEVWVRRGSVFSLTDREEEGEAG